MLVTKETRLDGHAQKKFETVYRGRQTVAHHLSYMRLSKVLLALRALRRSGITLTSQSVFDYGFGAGTFFLFCPPACHLAGVEQDSIVCEEVSRTLDGRGFQRVELKQIKIDLWKEHPLLQKDYDLFLCSHVLEHLPDPVDFLKTVRSCVRPDGVFLGLVPINERAENPHHVQKVNRPVIESWASDAGYKVTYYEENDPFLYWIQPFYAADRGWTRILGQTVRVACGMTSRVLGERVWYGVVAKVFFGFSRPTQAVFMLRPGKCGN